MPDSIAPSLPALLDDAGAAALVASYAPVARGAALKDIGRIDVHMRRFIDLSPLCLVSTADASGKQDVTPRGDPPGSFRVLDEHTIALADRPGNNRLDTLRNLLENPEIALIFLIPGVAETVRVAGTARLSVDAGLLASMAVQGKEPRCAIVISVRQAYLHCAKALLRSKLWQDDYVQPKGTFPSISRMVGDQIGLSEEDKKTAEARTERAYRDGLWAPIP
ncbi:MSMEG_1061 family FMN-dependent PPOX-type flavoprotein [Reyranella sp.]|uniref:MSMEG_1061 family FMN-dependent PPOX-type flavoprotein n=1 Tax=Reyranella sp. TaxID=1929291 RepID=UPI003BAD4CE5